MERFLELSGEVSAALQSGRPVVALESTVIVHGLPYPANLEVALAVEGIIRDVGGVPATVAVLRGKIQVGISSAEIEWLSKEGGIPKLGTRDLASAVACGWNGATTVSATAFAAARAGIGVLVTGGIGGVHRGASRTLDISSDLWELTKSSIVVVCAGVKGILDLPGTIEWLETHQVPVFGYGTKEFPAFYSRESGLTAESISDPEAVARLLNIRRSLGLQGGIVVAVPLPEEEEFDASAAISSALKEVEELGIQGKDVTPWLLARVAELTDGKSVKANVALLKNNAAVGAEIASALASLGGPG